MEKGKTETLELGERNKMYTICGNFANDDINVVNGQVTKTRNVAYLLKKTGKEITTIDTAKGKLKTFFSILKCFSKSEVFFLCVARNGTKFIAPILRFLKRFRKKTKIIFLCIGTCPFPKDYKPGNKLTKKEMRIGKVLSSFDAVCPETEVMKLEIENVFGLNNVKTFKNWQINKKIVENRIDAASNNKLVYFSRISREKNIEKLISAINELNQPHKASFEVDFYGPVEADVHDLFYEFINNNDNCFYKGVLDNALATETLCEYKALIFTTICLEGTPGTIIDAAFAGIPVISQPFWAIDELVVEPKIGFADENIVENIKKIMDISQSEMEEIRRNCYKFAISYSEDAAIERLNFLIDN